MSPDASKISLLEDHVKSLKTQLEASSESNAQLRAQVDDLMKKVRDSTVKLHKLQELQDPLHAEIRSLKAMKVTLTEQKDKESEERAMWQDKYTTYLRQTPRAGIEEAEYERVNAKLEAMTKHCNQISEKGRKLEEEVRDLKKSAEQQLQERQLLQTKLSETQTALSKSERMGTRRAGRGKGGRVKAQKAAKRSQCSCKRCSAWRKSLSKYQCRKRRKDKR